MFPAGRWKQTSDRALVDAIVFFWALKPLCAQWNRFLKALAQAVADGTVERAVLTGVFVVPVRIIDYGTAPHSAAGRVPEAVYRKFTLYF